jgi:ubiquinone/menaquinone biosynthesis C-methylase UbiE
MELAFLKSIRLPPKGRDLFLTPKFRSNGLIWKHVHTYCDPTQERVLDFGSGTGRSAAMFSLSHYVGFDIDCERVRFASSVRRRYCFVLGEQGRVPFGDERFDLVFVSSVLHHLSDNDVSYYSSEFKRVLRPDGRILVVEPINRVEGQFTNLYMGLCDRGPYIRFARDYMMLLSSDFQMQLCDEFRGANLYMNGVFFGFRVP